MTLSQETKTDLRKQPCRYQAQRQPAAFTLTSVLADGQLETDVSEFYEETRVRFSELSEEMLWEYIHSGEPM